MIALALVALALTLAHWVVLAARIPLLTELPWWFWSFSEQPLEGWPWLGLLVPAAALAVALARRASLPRAARIGALVLLGFVWQQGFALLEGRGLDGMRDHIVWTGHAQFARAAVRTPGAAELIRDYEERAPRGDHGKYAKSKPPGTLLLYVLTERVAGWLRPGARDFEERLAWLQTFASLTWPLLCYAVLLPMAALARRTLHPGAGAEAGVWAGALYLLVPSVGLMTLHTDQAFYPLLAVGCVALAARAAERGSAALAAAAGAVLYAAVFCSFGLAVVAVIAGAVAAALAPRARLPRLAAGAVAGFLACDVGLRFGFGYDIAARYESAMAHHLAWKFGWEWSVSNIAYIAALDFLDFTLWLGIPLAFATGAACVDALRRPSPRAALAGGLLAVFAGLLFLSRTKGEAARLWLFLVPFACLLAGDWLARRRERWPLPALAALQGGTVLLTKAFQDF